MTGFFKPKRNKLTMEKEFEYLKLFSVFFLTGLKRILIWVKINFFQKYSKALQAQ